VPGGTTVPNGVAIPTGLQPFGIGIYIPNISSIAAPDGNESYVTGTQTDGASVTNWNTGTTDYSIQLVCTHNVDHRTTLGIQAGP
jgi:hypothetical protein